MLEGIITEKGNVLGEDGKEYTLLYRGKDEEGYPKVLIDAKNAGGGGNFSRQSIKPYIGMRVSFECTVFPYGFNYKILKSEKEENENK